MQLREQMEDFLGGPVVETLTSNARGEGLIPGWGATDKGEPPKARVTLVKYLKVGHSAE